MADDPLLFISHARPDKARLKPFVDLLKKAGFQIFVDNPVAMGYTAEEAMAMKRLNAGGRWPEQLKEQVLACDCVLICWSKQALDREGLLREIFWADILGKLVICRIEPSELKGIGYGLDNEQSPLLSDGETFDAEQVKLLIAAMRDKIAAVKERRRRAGAGDRRDLERLPLLAGRWPEQSQLREALASARTSGGVRPVIVAGPNNELPEEFVQRFCDTAGLPPRGAGIGAPADGGLPPQPESIKRVDVVWPGGKGAFDDLYRPQLCGEVAPDSDYGEEAIATALANDRRPVVIYQEIYAESWRSDERARLIAWVRFWTRLAQLKPSMQAIPIVVVRLPKSDPGWIDFPPPGKLAFRARWKAKAIWETVKDVERQCADEPDLHTARILTLNLLQPIKRADVTKWLGFVGSRLDREGADLRTRVQQRVNRLYEPPLAQSWGVNHLTFREEVDKVLFPAATGARG